MNTDYHYDLAAWAAHQAELLKAGRMQDLDVANLIEEMEAMSRKEHRELLNRMIILIAHLLKWQYQPTHRGISWIHTIDEQRLQISGLVEDSPSLKNHFNDGKWLQKAWQQGVKQARNETGIKTLPQQPIWTINEIREKDFFE